MHQGSQCVAWPELLVNRESADDWAGETVRLSAAINTKVSSSNIGAGSIVPGQRASCHQSTSDTSKQKTCTKVLETRSVVLKIEPRNSCRRRLRGPPCSPQPAHPAHPAHRNHAPSMAKKKSLVPQRKKTGGCVSPHVVDERFAADQQAPIRVR